MDGNPNRPTGPGAGSMDINYLKTIPGMLKVAEIVSVQNKLEFKEPVFSIL